MIFHMDPRVLGNDRFGFSEGLDRIAKESCDHNGNRLLARA